MDKHQFTWHDDDHWHCQVCQWNWKNRKRSPCPGVVRYGFKAWPPHLKTAGELHRLGMRIPSSPDGCYYQRLEPHWLWLYDEQKATRLQTSFLKRIQSAFLPHTTCEMCGRDVHSHRDVLRLNSLCSICSFEELWTEQCQEIRRWAQNSLCSQQTILLNTETTGLGDTDTVIEIALISAEQGKTLYNTFIQAYRPTYRARTYDYASMENSFLSAPPFPKVWEDIVALLNQVQTVICYNADFHHKKLQRTVQKYDLPFPTHIKWECLMNRYATFYGKIRNDDPFNSFQWQKLIYACKQQEISAGQSLRPLARAKRAYRLLQALAKSTGIHYE